MLFNWPKHLYFSQSIRVGATPAMNTSSQETDESQVSLAGYTRNRRAAEYCPPLTSSYLATCIISSVLVRAAQRRILQVYIDAAGAIPAYECTSKWLDGQTAHTIAIAGRLNFERCLCCPVDRACKPNCDIGILHSSPALGSYRSKLRPNMTYGKSIALVSFFA
jgi:hypothetical protein